MSNQRSNRRSGRPRKGRPQARKPRRGAFPGLLRQPRDELKQTSISLAETAFYNGAGFYLTDCTSAITQGVTDAQRIGDHCYLDHIDFRAFVFNNTGNTANTWVHSRIIFFQFFGDNAAAAPAPSNLLLTSAANSGTTYGTWSNFAIDFVNQYKLLYDSGPMLTVGTNQIAAIGLSQSNVVTHKVGRVVPFDRNIRYYAAAATGPNHVYMLVTSDRATATSNPTVSHSVAMRFTDA